MSAIIVFLLAIAIGAAICGVIWVSFLIKTMIASRNEVGPMKVIMPIMCIAALGGIIALTVVCFK